MSKLNSPVLVLDRNWFASQITTVKDAISTTCAERAHIINQNYQSFGFWDWVEHTSYLDSHPEEASLYIGQISSPSVRIYLPQVIQVPSLVGSRALAAAKVKYSRWNIYRRDSYTCQYCHKRFAREGLTLDHIIPKCQGGTSEWTNVVTACKTCNLRKGHLSPEALGWQRPTPTAPDWRSWDLTKPGLLYNKYWQPFLLGGRYA
jgi:hypothetical protein